MSLMPITKKRFVNAIPLSCKAKNRFETTMKSFHACQIVDETDDLFFLVSLNKQYHFWIQKEGNEHWKIVK
jgi:hypothetical protein